MISTVEHYLETLLAFVPSKKNGRFSGDYVSLIHVPAQGAECVYTLTFGATPCLTVARYRDAVWEIVDHVSQGGGERPQLDALQAIVPADHPVFGFLDAEAIVACDNHSDGGSGLDYYLMLWQREGMADVVENWEPFSRDDQAWTNVIGALQTLAGQYEYATSRQ